MHEQGQDRPPKATASVLSRRQFTGQALQLGLAGTAGGALAVRSHAAASSGVELAGESFEYIVVGSGAGGGPVAAGLARAGYRVLLLEAGDPPAGADPVYDVPAYHPLATEERSIAWNFYVHHYRKDPQRDPKYVPARGGVLYPRSATVGGCTAHNAMIAIYPENKDWEAIRAATGDDSWSAEAMRGYFRRLERCTYRSLPPLCDELAQHGFDGWLPTSQASLEVLASEPLFAAVVAAAAARFPLGSVRNAFAGLDPNDAVVVQQGREGVYNVPTTTAGGQRRGARELVQKTAEALPDRLVVRTGALATKVLFDDKKRAIGVEYLEGSRLYAAHPEVHAGSAPRRVVRAAREVILAGGAFNSPQLLQLSGVGPAALLRRHGLDVVVDLPGVGRNLQDHLEIGLGYSMAHDFAPLRPCTFDPANDPCLKDYQKASSIYSTNGALCAVVARSGVEAPAADLCLFAIPGVFNGYYPDYSKQILSRKNVVSWVALRAFTGNKAGSVAISSADPRAMPSIDFRYFAEGQDRAGKDLQAMAKGIGYVRELMSSPLLNGLVAEELWPGPSVQQDDDIKRYIENQTWGHHASCTNKMGPPSDPDAVVDSRFRVHGTTALRVVDASVFPSIPGLFIVTPTYMIAEKACDVLIEDARAT